MEMVAKHLQLLGHTEINANTNVDNMMLALASPMDFENPLFAPQTPPVEVQPEPTNEVDPRIMQMFDAALIKINK
jgi:hypothetical protein